MFKRVSILLVLIGLVAGSISGVHAQQASAGQLSGSFAVDSPFYEKVPLLVGLNDASGLFGADPDYIQPPQLQVLGTTSGDYHNGQYMLALPAAPRARRFDVTGSDNADPRASGVLIFDVRLMSDVASKGYMVPNEDALASSLKIDVNLNIGGGTLLVWATNDQQQFPTDYGPDKKLFTADDPRTPIPAGWSIVNLDSVPFKITQDTQAKIDLATTGGSDVVDLTSLSCADAIPALLDRVQKTYPFTDLHHVDWNDLRAKLIPEAKLAQSDSDCQKIVRELGNAVHDTHADFGLPALRGDYAGGLGLRFERTSDGKTIVVTVRAGSVAEKAGIKLGAEITAWDGKPVDEALKNVVLQTNNESTPEGLLEIQMRLLPLGTVGSSVQIAYQNPGEQPTTATLTREQTQPARGAVDTAPDVKDNKLSSGIGYIRIPSFLNMDVFRQFDGEVDSLIKDNVPGIILDIRGNGGGLSQMSDAMASRFFDKMFVTGTEIGQDKRVQYMDIVDPRTPTYQGCLALLVDLNSVSASDLFAYTLKSQKRAIIVGNTGTSGAAGTVSGGQYYLPGKAFIQFPTGGFYDNLGNIIVEGQGVQPDVKVPVTVDSLLSPQDEVLQAADKAVQSCANQPATVTP